MNTFGIKSIRPFIGTKHFEKSQSFYKQMGFEEIVLDSKLSYFYSADFGFYLQDYYVKDWVDNSMVFMQVADVQKTHDLIISKKLTIDFPKSRFSEIKEEPWGTVFYVHDPEGILWHIASFKVQ